MNCLSAGIIGLVATWALAPLAAAQATPPTAAQATATAGDFVQPPAKWHFYSGFGFGKTGGEYGEFLEKPVSFELSLAKSFRGGAWRIGGGLQFGSTSMKPPYQEQEEWAHLETFLSVTRVFNRQGRIRPYLQGRVAAARVHPRSELFYYEEPENLEPGDSPTKAADGVGFTLQPGVEIALTKSLSLDVAGFWNTYNTSEYSLIPPLHGPLDPPLSAENTARNGREWGLRTGLAWQPFAGSPAEPRKKAPAIDPATGKLVPLPPADAQRDAWGVRRSWGWATGEMLGIDFVASMFNEYVRGANFNQISPRSFWHNLKEGFTWDDNQFSTNQFFHPWNGAAYFNAARANGIGFWGSSAMSVAGAFVWECCGETHPMSFNDMISTGIGGVARGEMMYRISSLILDNTKRGKGRWTREAAALLVNPIRGTNRLISGDAAEVKGNPEDPLEWRPEFQFALRTGARVIGEGESISENTNTYGFLEFVVNYGNPWDVDRHKPYDRFDVASQVNFGDKTNIGRLLIRGDLFTKPLGDGKRHLLTLQQDFDYINNEAYEYGGQSLGTALLSRFTPSPKLTLYSRVQAYAIILGAVNSDYSQLADVAEQERIREYDYGPGVGGAVELYLQRKNLPLVTARYRYSYINVSNGSVYNGTYEGYNVGLESDHDIHQVNLKLEIPLGRSLTIGADGSVFLRRSRYNVTVDTPDFGPPRRQTITQRNPELRAFVAWNYNH